MNTRKKLHALLVALIFLPLSALADSGFYVGGSVGGATLDADFSSLPGFPSSIDEDDTAFKAFLGYRFDLPSTFLAVEGGYVDFGEPDFGVPALNADVTIDTSGTNLWGIAGLEAGPMELFAKLGYVAWDIKVEVVDQLTGARGAASDDGSDTAYGLGLGFNVGPVYLRGEYEVYEAEGDDISMVSVGISYLFD